MLVPMMTNANNPFSSSGQGLDFTVHEDAPLDFRLMHQFILQQAGDFEVSSVLAQALQMFWSKSTALHPDVQGVVYK